MPRWPHPPISCQVCYPDLNIFGSSFVLDVAKGRMCSGALGRGRGASRRRMGSSTFKRRAENFASGCAKMRRISALIYIGAACRRPAHQEAVDNCARLAATCESVPHAIHFRPQGVWLVMLRYFPANSLELLASSLAYGCSYVCAVPNPPPIVRWD